MFSNKTVEAYGSSNVLWPYPVNQVGRGEVLNSLAGLVETHIAAQTFQGPQDLVEGPQDWEGFPLEFFILVWCGKVRLF